jgi:hypothetical protein
MAYTDVFGGELLFPSQLSYLAITTAVDVTLQWPREQQIEGTNIVADFLDINTTAAALNIDFPDARNTSTGNKSTVNNIGGNDFTVRDATGGVIQFVGTGEQWVIVLTDNSTEAGTWSAFQLGAATTLASASALAGAGLQADGFGMLEQIIDSDVEASTPVTVVDGDRAKCLIYTGGAGQVDLPSAGTVGNNWFFMLRNSGSGTLNIVPPAGSIDGSSSVNLDPNGSTFIFTDGTDYFTIGLTVASTIAFDFVSLPIPGSGDFVLSGANLNRIAYRFTGALTGNRKVVVPNTTQQYWCDNETTGAFTLEIATAAQVTPPQLAQGSTAIFYCDATNVINAVDTVSVTFPVLISQGGTSATDAPTAVANLGALPTIVDLTGDTPAAGDFIPFQDVDAADVNRKATLTDIVNAGEPQQLFDTTSNVRISAETGGIAQIRSNANLDTNNRRLDFTHADQTIRGQFGYTGSAEFLWKNSIQGGDIVGEVEAVGGGVVEWLRYDPTAGQLGFVAENVLRGGFDNGEQAWRAQVNSFMTLHFNNIESARTATTASGGLFVTNLATGAGSERVLTTSDLPSGGGSITEILTGSFTGTLTGTVGTPTATFQYIRTKYSSGMAVFELFPQADIDGTSNTTAMTITGLPSDLEITNLAPFGALNLCEVQNSGSGEAGAFSIPALSGILTFSMGSPLSTTGFTASGTKGLFGGTRLVYMGDPVT